MSHSLNKLVQTFSWKDNFCELYSKARASKCGIYVRDPNFRSKMSGHNSVNNQSFKAQIMDTYISLCSITANSLHYVKIFTFIIMVCWTIIHLCVFTRNVRIFYYKYPGSQNLRIPPFRSSASPGLFLIFSTDQM